MKAFAVTDRGIENVLAMEITEFTGAKADLKDSCALFDCAQDDLLKFCYFTQASDRVAIFLANAKFEDLSSLITNLSSELSLDAIGPWLENGISFRVHCERRGLHDFNSTIAEQEAGGIILEKAGNLNLKVDLKSPKIIFYLFIRDDNAFFGIDLSGRDLSKRQYRIFTVPGIINAKIAYALVRIAGLKKGMRMIDLNAGAGLIPIEAAIWLTRTSISNYNKDFSFKKLSQFKDTVWDDFFSRLDKEKNLEKLNVTGYDPLLRNLEASKKNAKLAGIDKFITFSKLDLEWMDSKLNESTIDLVISRIPCASSHFSEGNARKFYNELFYQAEFFLKGDGRMCLLSESLLLLRECATKDFKVESEGRLWSGGQEYEYAILLRKSKKGE